MSEMDDKPEGLQLDAPHWAIVSAILAKHLPGIEVWAFGSRTKGLAKPHSDLDLAVINQEPMSIQVQAALAEAFSESDLPWRVDVVDWSSTQEAFRHLIAQHKLVVQKSKDACGDT